MKKNLFEPTHCLLTPRYQISARECPNFLKLCLTTNFEIWAFRKTTLEDGTKKSTFFIRRVSQTVAIETA